MMRGCFDHSAIWSRTKIWRRKRSSVVCASEIRSGRVGIRLSGAIADGRHRIDKGHPGQVVDLDPFVDRVLAPRAWAVRDGRGLFQAPDAVPVVHEGLHPEGER